MAGVLSGGSALLGSKSALVGQNLKQRSPVCRAQVRTSTVAAASSRPTWCPGWPVPKHLDGSLPADFGFDPLNLGAEPEALRWYTQAELIHSRWAMTAVAGILIPDIFVHLGVLNLPEWYNAGKVAQQNSFASFGTLLGIQLILFGFVETKRWMDFARPGSQAEDGSFFGLDGALKGQGTGYPGGPFDPLNYCKGNGYPGGPFDPLNYSKGNKSTLDEYEVKELKNGRLAMLAFLGFNAQFAATGKGPLDNLFDHLRNPTLVNFTTNPVSLPSFPFKT